MQLWLWILLLAAAIKLPIAGLMLWLPFRHDEEVRAAESQDSPEEDGGSMALPGGPTDPHPRVPSPRRPRRGPHGSPSPPAPARVRTTVARGRRPARVCD
jgi:hypothetical protein